MSITDELDALIEQLDRATAGASAAPPLDQRQDVSLPPGPDRTPDLPGRADAIDRILAAPPRHTATASLRETEIVRQFREDLLSGQVRIERLRQFLSIVGGVVAYLVKRDS